jgi:DNA polymerase III subunit epsilon
LYAIIDIETTGGQFNEEGITEIAIYKFDGHEIIDQFVSLVNPEIPIQPFVVKLTGINDAMLRSAPKFFEVAKRIIEMTNDCVLVAHNAEFDYRILRTEFRRLGYDFKQKTLCTVELSKKLLPEQTSHSLGKLVRALGIPMADRHRASGDALATVKLFKLLLDKDLNKEIVKELIKFEVQKGIAPKLLDIIESLPSKTGIYYIHREDGNIIFIGKSRNIKKRVNQHFTGITRSAKKIQNEVFTVTYEETGSELISILKESEEIKRNKPIYNRMSPKSNFTWAIYIEKDENQYLNLKLQKVDGRKKDIKSYISQLEGKEALMRISSEYNLCHKLTGLIVSKNNCFKHTINECDGACIGKITAAEYNVRVQDFIDKNQFETKTLVIVDRGRTISERSAVLVENGVFKGYTFFDLNYQINTIEILRNMIVPMQSTRDSKNSIQNYIRKGKMIKIVNF